MHADQRCTRARRKPAHRGTLHTAVLYVAADAVPSSTAAATVDGVVTASAEERPFDSASRTRVVKFARCGAADPPASLGRIILTPRPASQRFYVPVVRTGFGDRHRRSRRFPGSLFWRSSRWRRPGLCRERCGAGISARIGSGSRGADGRGGRRPGRGS